MAEGYSAFLFLFSFLTRSKKKTTGRGGGARGKGRQGATRPLLRKVELKKKTRASKEKREARVTNVGLPLAGLGVCAGVGQTSRGWGWGGDPQATPALRIQ